MRIIARLICKKYTKAFAKIHFFPMIVLIIFSFSISRMEQLFLLVMVRAETILVGFFGSILAIFLLYYLYGFIRKVLFILWPRKFSGLYTRKSSVAGKTELQKKEEEIAPPPPPPLSLDDFKHVPSTPMTEAIVTDTEDISSNSFERNTEQETETKQEQVTIVETSMHCEYTQTTQTIAVDSELSKEQPIPQEEENLKAAAPVQEIETAKNDDTFHPKNTSKSHKKLPQEDIFPMIAEIKTLIAKRMYSDARTIIVKGLALQKEHRELNLLLGTTYEAEERFAQAEIVYKDLAHLYPDDYEILKRLANILIIVKNNVVAYELYKKILGAKWDEEDTLFILAHLTSKMNKIEESYQYAKEYLNQWPNNKDILLLLSDTQIALGKRNEAIETLGKVKNISPYDAFEINQTIQKLLAEEELAHNFGN